MQVLPEWVVERWRGDKVVRDGDVAEENVEEKCEGSIPRLGTPSYPFPSKSMYCLHNLLAYMSHCPHRCKLNDVKFDFLFAS